jgi:hypothetical protein
VLARQPAHLPPIDHQAQVRSGIERTARGNAGSDYANDIGWIGGAEAVSAMTIQFNTSGWNA